MSTSSFHQRFKAEDVVRVRDQGFAAAAGARGGNWCELHPLPVCRPRARH